MKKKMIMGIVNCTPDSFYDGGLYFNSEKASIKSARLVEEGADIIDIGGESSRPGADPVLEKEELERVLPVIEEVSKNSSLVISIDTYKANVAKKALESGARWVNDITGGSDPKMREVVAESQATFCLMHMKGNPKNMQEDLLYSANILDELQFFFEKRVDLLIQSGIAASKIIIDPGIGFGKSVDQTLTILKHLPKLKALGFPLLIGASRKSFLSKILQKQPSELLAATLAINSAIFPDVDYFRVHDVKEHRQMIDLLSAIHLNCI